MDKQEKVKLIIAVVILVLALGVIVWYFGLRGGGTEIPPGYEDVDTELQQDRPTLPR